MRTEMKWKKIWCLMLATAMIFSLCMIPKEQVKAESIFDLAEQLDTEDSVTCYPTSSKDCYYKFTLKEKGMLTLKIQSKRRLLYVKLYDEDGNRVTNYSDMSASRGSIDYVYPSLSSNYKAHKCYWNNAIEKFQGSISWELAAGTYCLLIESVYDTGHPDTTLTTSFKSTESKSATAIAIQLELPIGSSLKLNALLTPTNSSSKVTWKSSKKSVCKVSSDGEITAVSKGTCNIYAIANGHKTKIRIKVVK